MNWIRYHLPGRHWLLNDCRAGENPFEGAQLSGSLVHGLFGEHKVFHLRRELQGSFAFKGTLLYNFEEVDLREANQKMTLTNEREWLGTSGRRDDVLILRDPFNLLASKLKWAYGEHERPSKPTLDDIYTARDLWKVYAREYLRETRFLSDPILISYNDWFLHRSYRDGLGTELGFRNEDRGVHEVAKWGPTLSTDSFDGLRFDGRAQDMDVLERWKAFAQDPVYQELVHDPELQDLSARIFGDMAVSAMDDRTESEVP